MNVMKDAEFQKVLLQLVCRDRSFLKDVSYLLDADDFKPASKEDSKEKFVIAELALDYYRKTREPIGPALRWELIDYAEKKRFSDKQTEKLLKLAKDIQSDTVAVSVDAIAEKIVAFKKTRIKKRCVEQMIQLQEKGQLTDDEWYRLCMKGVESVQQGYKAIDVLSEGAVEDRIKRRSVDERLVKYPFLLIDEYDEKFRLIKRGMFGLVMAFLKGGKSLLLLWLAIAYAFQGLRVLFFTLEDPADVVEDRLDSALTHLAMRDLSNKPTKFRNRFKKIRQLMRGRIKIIDGTDGGISIAKVEDIWERERNRGYNADVIIIDYDDEVEPPKKRNERRFEFADIYKAFRQFLARRDLYGWMAAQTGRKGEGKKVISAGMIAEDISKIRKVALCLGIGDGDWGQDSKFLSIVAAKNEKMKVGFNIMTDYKCGLFYDRDATLRKLSEERKKNKKRKDN